MRNLLSTSLRQTVAIVLVISLLSGAAAAAVTVTALNLNPIASGSGTLSGSADISIDSTDFVYTGTNVTGVDVKITNSGTATTVDIHVAFRRTDGTAIETQTLAGKSIGGSSTATFTVSPSSTPGVDEFSEFEVTVEKTG